MNRAGSSGSRPGHSGEAHGRSLGFTLLELMTALAIGSVLLLALAGLLSTARAGEGTLARTVEPRQALSLAAELLREELGLAGFVPWPAAIDPATSEPMDTPQSAMAVVVSDAGLASQEIRVAYVDDRLASGPLARDLTFSTGLDGRGVAQLYRRAAGFSRQPLVEGVAALRLGGFVDGAGLHAGPHTAGGGSAHAAVWALLVELTATSGESQTLLVELPSRPDLVIEP